MTRRSSVRTALIRDLVAAEAREARFRLHHGFEFPAGPTRLVQSVPSYSLSFDGFRWFAAERSDRRHSSDVILTFASHDGSKFHTEAARPGPRAVPIIQTGFELKYDGYRAPSNSSDIVQCPEILSGLNTECLRAGRPMESSPPARRSAMCVV
jgi:hypothetical protein